MEAVMSSMENEEKATDTLFSYLDKGIDDMEAGRLHPVDDAFQIITDRLASEL